MSETEKQNNRAPGYGRVAVLMGGSSAEREVSIETGTAVHAALCRQGIDASMFDTGKQSLQAFLEQGFDRAFIALHGRGGEDGVIQGALQAMGIPYTGSGVIGSALGMDKVRSKLIWIASGLATPGFVEINAESDLEKVETELGLPVIIKPVHEGSSCGATKVKNRDELKPAWEKARDLDDRVLAETWVEGVEYTVAILGNSVLPFIRLETPREFYDYEAKYIEDTTQYICPAGLSSEAESTLATMVTAAFAAVGASGWGRIDFIIDGSGKAWLIEVNTVPGMTSHSLVPMSAKQAGIDFDSLVMSILETSMSSPEIRRGRLSE
ncbi:MAG: D-alanine--D-alanine ligase [Gammaproteobacteria bacterium]